MEREEWTDRVLTSLTGIAPVSPNPFLLTRIEAAIDGLDRQTVPRSRVRWVIAGLAMLGALNLVALVLPSGTVAQASDRRDATSTTERMDGGSFFLYE